MTASQNTRPSRPILVVNAVLAGIAALLLLILVADHTIGGEIDGVIVAVVGLAAGVAALAGTVRRVPRLRSVVVILWLVTAGGGILGVVEHVAAPNPGDDPRPRPATAPLVFTLLGIAGIGVVAAPSIVASVLGPGPGSDGDDEAVR